MPYRVLELLRRYYQGELANLDEQDGTEEGDGDDDGDDDDEDDGDEDGEGADGKDKKRRRKASGDADGEAADGGADGDSQLLTERLAPRKGLPPLLVNLADRKPERLHYLGGWLGGPCVEGHGLGLCAALLHGGGVGGVRAPGPDRWCTTHSCPAAAAP